MTELGISDPYVVLHGCKMKLAVARLYKLLWEAVDLIVLCFCIEFVCWAIFFPEVLFQKHALPFCASLAWIIKVVENGCIISFHIPCISQKPSALASC